MRLDRQRYLLSMAFFLMLGGGMVWVLAGCAHARIHAALQSPPETQRLSATAGAYYFDGWASSENTGHLRGLTTDLRFAGRRPLYGWLDNTPQIMSQQLAWAHRDGLSFFVFEWYHLHSGSPLPAQAYRLNNALGIYRSLPSHEGMKYALLDVNAASFAVSAKQWPTVITEWVTQYFTDSNYERINGKPVLYLINLERFANQVAGFGGAQGPVESANRALAALQDMAKAHGLPGVYIVGGVGEWKGYPAAFTFENPSLLRDVHVDALTEYNNPFAGGSFRFTGAKPYSDLERLYQWAWENIARSSPHPYIPVVVDGRDARPWNEPPVTKEFGWYERTPDQFEHLVRLAIDWANEHPSMRIETPDHPPLVLIEAWNELGEGAYIVPTVGDGDKYGQALARALKVTR